MKISFWVFFDGEEFKFLIKIIEKDLPYFWFKFTSKNFRESLLRGFFYHVAITKQISILLEID